MFFIRAPAILRAGDSVRELAKVVHPSITSGPGAEGVTVAAESDQILVTTFHPELTNDHRIHQYFVEKSSRSHALFILRITFPIKDESRTRIRNSTLNLIDLAGSERVKKSGAAGQRMREGQNINSSLSVLGQVISKLAQGKFKHVPFRQSKLTYLLTDALNGNSKTHMVAAISPALSEMEETLGTLRFASSVKKVRTHAVSNEQEIGESDLLLQTMRSEAEELKAAALKAKEESPQQARRYMKSAEAVEHAVLSIQTRIDKTMWSQAQLAQQEASRLRNEALAGLSLPFNIGGMLGGQSEHAVTANSPYLLNISDDISLAGRLLYFLPEGPPISIGSEENNRIRLMGLGIPDHLCDISVVAGGKGVEVQHSGRGGRLIVDGVAVSDNQAIALYNGARIIFGRAFAFRLVIPLASQGGGPGGRGMEDEDLLMRAAALPSPFPACEGDTLQRLRLLIETSVAPVLGETECAEIMRGAGEVHNDVDEGWMGLGHESSFKANELLKEIEQTPLQASAFYESASSRVCRAKEIGTFPMLRFSLHEYFPTRPGPQSKFRLCILYEH
ncbi:unnamed protein product [Cladocopium goreaui]|uniref:Kinesin-like protein n=1 Tax=Cladocopium goreaui TaxID=2562237 RepID=A0A9P1CMM6_9DINO|nr:unnamed protein product [Cladocopium goreaui]